MKSIAKRILVYFLMIIVVLLYPLLLIKYNIELNLNKRNTKIMFGFRSKYQLPLFMIWKEYYDDYGEVTYAKVIFMCGLPRKYKNIQEEI